MKAPMFFIGIQDGYDGQVFRVDTLDEIETARQALKRHGIPFAEVIASPADEDSPGAYANGQILFAAE
jgi:hypothetical protein